MAAKRLYRCGCGKWITRHVPAPEYKGIFSVHQDGTRCSSMHEGDCETLADMRAQARLTTQFYAERAFRYAIAAAEIRLRRHFGVMEAR